MPRFFVELNQIEQNNIFIYGDDAKHIISVLRMKINDRLTICDGNAFDYDCIIKNILKDSVKMQILNKYSNETEFKVKLKLFQSLPKYDKMEFIIQKCVELGVDEIIPVITENTIVKPDNKKNNKIERWNKISEAASKQSMRGKIPKILQFTNYIEALKLSQTLDMCIIPYENEKINKLRSSIKGFNGKSIGIFIGPEGGFTDKEILTAKQYNIIPITLGKTILRTETAGLITLANIIYELGDD